MPTFTTSDTRIVTIQAPRDRIAEALSTPDHVKEFLADDLESATKLDDQTIRWIRKPVEEKGVRFRGDYTVEYRNDGQGTVSWHSIGAGNMRTKGEARLASVGDGSTRVELTESIECDMEVNRVLAAVLRPIIERKIKSGIAGYLEKVKAALEATPA